MADRTDSLNGWIWADGAGDPPAVPVTGVTYATSSLAQATVEEGWPYSEVVNSANFNEIMRRATSILSLLETYGILPWSALTTYPVGAVATGSDGLIYKALLTSTPAAPKDPISNVTYWRPQFVPATSSLQGLVELATDAETQIGTDAGRAITPAGLASFGKLFSTNGYYKFPGGFIAQWGQGSNVSGSSGVPQAVTFPIPFPTACFHVFLSEKEPASNLSTQYLLVLKSKSVTVNGFTIYLDANSSAASAITPIWFAIGY